VPAECPAVLVKWACNDGRLDSLDCAGLQWVAIVGLLVLTGAFVHS